MASPSLHINAIVLKKTKLAESDLIITFLCEDGSQLRAVAKGARKPSSTFSSRLELFTNVNVLLAEGKNLSIVREAKIIKSYDKIRKDIEKTTCATPALELLEKVSQVNLISENLYPLTLNFLDEVSDMSNTIYLKSLCAAHLIKVCSFVGFRPFFASCVICNDDIYDFPQNANIKMNFSYVDGGVVCLRCRKKTDTTKIHATTVQFLHKLIHTKFEDIKYMTVSKKEVNESLDFCKNWILFYLGSKMKSLSFYMKNI